MTLIKTPRDKLINYGPSRLKDFELLSIVINSGTKKKDVFKTAYDICHKLSKEELINLSPIDFQKKTGLGLTKSCQIVACFELGKRLLTNKKTIIIMKPEDIFNELREIRDKKKEYFVIFYLDVKNQIIKKEIISIGILNASLIHPREVFEPAITNFAGQIIIAHNHPSGDCQPSKEDVILTHNLVSAGKILDIEIIDHIIVTTDQWFSMKEKKMM